MVDRPALGPELSALLPRYARTFAFAARFLPPAQRESTVVLYAFCRLLDDLVDESPPDLDRAAIRARLTAWRGWLTDRSGSAPEPRSLAAALGAVMAEYRVPASYLLYLLDGLESDLQPVRLADFAALRRYCFQVAGSVGLAMCCVLGARRPSALHAAVELGVAMQLTNVLRDVGADLRRDRVYLPADELARFGLSAERLIALAATGRPDEAFRALMRFQIERARTYYARGLAGVWLLPPEARPAILIAGRLYRAILDCIEARGYDVLTRRASTSAFTRCRQALAALVLVRLWGGGWVADESVAPTAQPLELAWLES